MALHSLLYGAAIFGVSAHALAFPGPQPTDPFQALPQNAWSPKPTPGPDAHALLRRQLALPATYLLAPDNTCGFVNGNSKSAYACVEDDMKCAFIPSSGKSAGAAGCCKGSSCAFRVACLGKADMDDCGKKCQADAQTLKCTGAARFCNTVAFPGGVTDYYCITKRQTAVLKAQTTHTGNKSRKMSTVKPSSTSTKKTTSSTSTKKTSSSLTSSSTSKQSSSTTSSSISTETAFTSTETPAATSSATDAAVAGAATSASPVATTAPATPTGAIVGGVLGGVALLALIVFGSMFLRQNRKNAAAAEAAAEFPPPQPSMAEATFPGSQPPPPTYAQNTASSHMSGYPPSSHVSGYPPSHDVSATATPAHMYAVPVTAAVGAGAGLAAGAAAGTFRSHHSHHHHPSLSHSNSYTTTHHHNTYPEPSPMSTPNGSPRPQYHHQPHAPPPLPQPSYYHHHSHSSSAGHHSQDYRGAGEDTWSARPDPPDRRDTSTPVSTYNGTTPVLPASALGPMPGEPQQGHAGGSGGSGVPLILQPGMGYRPYRPGGGSIATAGVTTVTAVPGDSSAVAVVGGGGSGQGSGAVGASNVVSGQGSEGGDGNEQGNAQDNGQTAAAVRAVSSSPGPEQAKQQPAQQQPTHAAGAGSQQDSKAEAVELP